MKKMNVTFTSAAMLSNFLCFAHINGLSAEKIVDNLQYLV